MTDGNLWAIFFFNLFYGRMKHILILGISVCLGTSLLVLRFCVSMTRPTKEYRRWRQ